MRDIEALSTQQNCWHGIGYNHLAKWFIIHWIISMNMRDIEALSTQQNCWHGIGYNHLAKLLFYNTLNHFKEHERYRGALHKIVFIGFQNNHFYKIYTLFLFNELERYRGSPLNKNCLNGIEDNHFANLFFLQYIHCFFSMNLSDIEAVPTLQ